MQHRVRALLIRQRTQAMLYPSIRPQTKSPLILKANGANMVRQLGWQDVMAIDDDLGLSGSGIARPGFERLSVAVTAGQVETSHSFNGSSPSRRAAALCPTSQCSPSIASSRIVATLRHRSAV